MSKIIGIIVILGSVLGGYLLSGGKIAAIIQPFEVLIIGGAALGAFLQANPGSTFMTVLKKAPKMFSNRFTHTFYLEVLGMLYEVLNKSRREGMMAIEADVEDPGASPIFSKYPAVLKDDRMTAYICDYLRIMSSGNMAPHELEGLFDMELFSLKEELEHPSHAVTGIAEVINNPGLVNVDFADVRTVMSEVGMAMMGSAMADGETRARDAAQAAVRSPLLEEVNLAGARGVLVNITASATLKMKEYHEVMNTIKEFTAEDAMVIVGTVLDEAMEDRLRVTMIATGLGGAVVATRKPPKLEVLETVVDRTGTDNVGMRVETIDYDKLDQPAVVRRGRHAVSAPAPAFDPSEIPAFLRKQAD